MLLVFTLSLLEMSVEPPKEQHISRLLTEYVKLRRGLSLSCWDSVKDQFLQFISPFKYITLIAL